MAFYIHFHAFPSFDSGAVGDHFRVAVAISACETDLSYPAVGLSDYSRMTPIATSSCQPVVYPPVAQWVSDRSVLLDAVSLYLNVALL